MMRVSPYEISRALGLSLLQRGLKLAVAESCTGGSLSDMITAVAGSSQWFDSGIVTYSNEAKIKLLNVSPETLHYFGEVSHETAIEMARGVLNRCQVDVSLSITGVAGPSGGTEVKPVGTVCFGMAFSNGTIAWRQKLFDSGRQHVRDSAVNFALGWLLHTLQN
jgi:nicotinamide-nucleotide amidase